MDLLDEVDELRLGEAGHELEVLEVQQASHAPYGVPSGAARGPARLRNGCSSSQSRSKVSIPSSSGSTRLPVYQRGSETPGGRSANQPFRSVQRIVPWSVGNPDGSNQRSSAGASSSGEERASES